MTKKQRERANRLLPDGIPRYVRIYDSGENGDRYTVVFAGNWPDRAPGWFPYLSMSGAPFHPQGVCTHGEINGRAADCRKGQWGGVSIGRSCHLGKRICFSDLPKDCQTAVLNDYKSYWELT